jgi:hypothetical protein
MRDHVLRAAELNLAYAKKLLADIPDEKMAVQPAPGMNHAAWVLGHLTFVGDAAIRVFDLPYEMKKEWGELFNMTSKPVSDRSVYPSKDELWTAYERAYRRLSDTVKAAPLDVFDREHPNPKLRAIMPTIGVAVTHVLCTHHGLHLGQLSAWRRAQGLPAA